MSLFPAYSLGETSSNIRKPPISQGDQDWLSNPSFISLKTKSESLDESFEITDSRSVKEKDKKSLTRKLEKKHKKKERKYRKAEKDDKGTLIIPQPIPDFDGTEEYYVDKKSERGYSSIITLHKPACPRYKLTWRTLGHLKSFKKKPYNRYFLKNSRKIGEDTNKSNKIEISQNEFLDNNKKFNSIVANNPHDINNWLEFVKYQDNVGMKSTKTQIAERKIDILDKALLHNPGNEKLYALYVETINNVYPSFQVSKILEKLMFKDQTSYILWNALILATQGSMARCIVPDVLKLYERCMQSFYNKLRDDFIMLKLFKNCAYFLRQSGLYEQFFALIKLALELNVSPDKFGNIKPLPEDQQTLIEYEEVVLQSGLPMNEIWLRIEKLRTNFNFLPCPDGYACSDPQRIVFNEDICYFIYPLVNNENSIQLIFTILKLLKIPLTIYKLDENHICNEENLAEFDCTEDILSVYLYRFLNGQNDFDIILYDLIRDLNIGPSYLNTNIGYEIYLNVITEILFQLADCNTGRRRTIFLLLWLRLERILMIVDKITNKFSKERSKKLKTKIKNCLKRDKNRNESNFYVEYAIIEYEMDNLEMAENILETTLSENYEIKTDKFFAYVTYTELLMKEQSFAKGIRILSALGLDCLINEVEYEVKDPRKLLVLKKFTDLLNDLIFIERNVEIMEVEQTFLPDYLINLIKAKVYYTFLIKTKLEALSQIEILLRTFCEKNNRHSFIRENLYELFMNLVTQPDHNRNSSGLGSISYDFLNRGLSEFPNNLFLLRTAATLIGQPWYKLKSLMTKSSSPFSIIFLIASIRYRLKQNIDMSDKNNEFFTLSSDIDLNASSYKCRVLNLLKEAINKNASTRKNSLMWRLYLRSLFDVEDSLERCKNTLFSALDECPWNKSLYLDGAIYVPHDLTQIQDLIIEKQLRIYALPEELEILRNDQIK